MWGHHPCPEIETIHLKFCKFALGSQLLHAVWPAKLGCYPVVYRRKILMVNYWLSLHNWNAPAFVAEAYRMLLNLNQQGQQTWLTRVRNILRDAGLNYIWHNLWDVCPLESVEILRVTLQDQYTQHWCSLLQATAGKLQTYKQFKRNLTFEP